MDFVKVLSDSAIPTTKVDLENMWRDEVTAQGSKLSNESQWSPFWNILTALVTMPVMWFINFLSQTIMPASFVNTATGEYLDLHANSVNLNRNLAIKTKGIITFTRASLNTSISIPLGTIIQSAPINGIIYQVKTTQAKSFSTGQYTLDIPIEAINAGSAYNLADGFYSVLNTPISGISEVSNNANWITTAGTNTESDSALRARIRNQYGTVSKFHTDSVYKSIIANIGGIAINDIYFVHNAPRGAGTANAYCVFDLNVDATATLAKINNYITGQEHHGHGDDLQVFQLPTQALSLSVDCWYPEYLTTAQVNTLRTAISAFINCAFRNNSNYSPTLTTPYERFSFSRLSKELHQQFSDLYSIDFNHDDIVCGLWIPDLTLNIAMHVKE